MSESDQFAAGYRYAVAKLWDFIERGGNTYVLDQVFQEVLRVEAGQLPPDIIDTNRGQRIAWEQEFNDMLRGRFKSRLPVEVESKLRSKKIGRPPVAKKANHRAGKKHEQWKGP